MDDATARDIFDAVAGISDRELRGFATVDHAPNDADLAHTHNVPVAAVAFEQMLDLLLRSLHAFSEPAGNKTGWIHSFYLGDRSCRLRWTKSGIRLDLFGTAPNGRSDAADASSIANRLIKAASSLYRRVVTPRLQPGLAAGRAVVLNQLPRYRGMVDFHRQTIEDATKSASGSVPNSASTDASRSEFIQRLVQGTFGSAFRDREQSYRATALVAGYSSWVQHLLVVLSAFSPKVLDESFSLEDLLTAKWAAQFDVAYPKPHDQAVTRLKAELSDLARDFRNPLLHGGGGRFEDGVVVEWTSGHEALAIDPDAVTDQYMLLRPSLTVDQIGDLLDRLDRIDAAFEKHPFFAWAAEGLQADFRREAVELALKEQRAGNAGAFTDAVSQAFDDAVNWDR